MGGFVGNPDDRFSRGFHVGLPDPLLSMLPSSLSLVNGMFYVKVTLFHGRNTFWYLFTLVVYWIV